MAFLDDIDEVTEVTEETNTNKGSSTPKTSRIEYEPRPIFDMGQLGESHRSGGEETAPTKVSKSIMISVDSDIIERISNMDGDSDDGSDMRQANLCCFSCCDLLRASIITNSIFIVLMVIFFSLAIYDVPTLHWLGVSPPKMDDDAIYLDTYNSYDDYFHSTMAQDPIVGKEPFMCLVRTALAILFSAIGIYGASKFHQGMVLCTAMWYVVYIIWSGIDQVYSSVVLGMLFSYPNWHLFFELRRGSITPEYYWREKYCCCDCCYGSSDYPYPSEE